MASAKQGHSTQSLTGRTGVHSTIAVIVRCGSAQLFTEYSTCTAFPLFLTDIHSAAQSLGSIPTEVHSTMQRTLIQ